MKKLIYAALIVLCIMMMVSLLSNIRVEAAGQGHVQGQGQGHGQGISNTSPGQTKKDELSPGMSKKESMPYDAQKRQDLLEMKPREELQQAWCLERKGSVNYVLQDTTVCGCLTENHVVAFVEAEEWTEAIGLVLHHALVLRKDPGIVVFVEPEGETEQTQESAALASLNKVIEEFKLPITVWTLTLEPKEEEEGKK
jgi:hypothetical protein